MALSEHRGTEYGIGISRVNYPGLPVWSKSYDKYPEMTRSREDGVSYVNQVAMASECPEPTPKLEEKRTGSALRPLEWNEHTSAVSRHQVHDLLQQLEEMNASQLDRSSGDRSESTTHPFLWKTMTGGCTP